MHLPLSELLRPKNLQDITGQAHLLDSDGWLIKSIENQKPLSLLFYGPPGCGKTTLAKLYSNAFKFRKLTFSGATSSIADIKKEVAELKKTPLLSTTILFVDELHRLNKAQQDFFLPLIEDGTLVLLGATTENPSFTINNALLSRMRACTLNPLDDNDLNKIIEKYESLYSPLGLEQKDRLLLIKSAKQDARVLLNSLAALHSYQKEKITPKILQKILQAKPAFYDKHGDQHYNLVSALHKSVRGSDPDAALYWLERMLLGGEDRLYLLRRLIRMASEDIGLADPSALLQATATHQTYQILGSPEGELAIAQLVIYLSLAPKSNATYLAQEAAKEKAETTNEMPPPNAIINAPTQWMKEQGFGKDYEYDHDTPFAFSGQNYFPKKLPRPNFYQPKTIGFERELKKRMEYFASLRKKLNVEEIK